MMLSVGAGARDWGFIPQGEDAKDDGQKVRCDGDVMKGQQIYVAFRLAISGHVHPAASRACVCPLGST